MRKGENERGREREIGGEEGGRGKTEQKRHVLVVKDCCSITLNIVLLHLPNFSSSFFFFLFFVRQSEKGLIPLFPRSHCPLTSESGSTAFKIPPSIHQRICATFDSANSKGKDWQLLAQKLHVDR